GRGVPDRRRAVVVTVAHNRIRRAARLLSIGALALAPAALARAGSDAEVAADLERLCRAVLCRKPAPVHFKLPDGQSFEMTPAAPTPVVSGGWVTVYPDETVMVEARLADGRLVDLKAVSEIRAPERTLVFHLNQDAALADGTGMILKVESPFAGAIKYRLAMMLPSGENKITRTSACP